MKQTQPPEQWHRVAAEHMLEMRGWARGKAPRNVVDNVFATMVRWRSEEYYARGDTPGEAAREMQTREWDRMEAGQ